MEIAIYGAGALGIVLGAYLTEKNVPVDMFHHRREFVDKLNKDGAIITGKVNKAVKVNAILSSEITKKYDIIFLLTKQTANDEIANDLKTHLTENGVVVTMQNGIPELKLMDLIGPNKVLGSTVQYGATLVSDGVTKLTSDESTFIFSIGSFENKNHPMLKPVKEILEKIGTVEVLDNFIGARYVKLLVNSSFTGLSTAMNITFGEVSKNKTTRKYAQALIKECIDVAKANDIKIEKMMGLNISKIMDYKTRFKKWIGYLIIPLAMKSHSKVKASMLYDLTHGRKTEVHDINGSIVRLGEKKGLNTKFNKNLIEVIEKIENGELTPSIDNLKYFKI